MMTKQLFKNTKLVTGNEDKSKSPKFDTEIERYNRPKIYRHQITGSDEVRTREDFRPLDKELLSLTP